jgi:hypothetical protein
LICKAEFGLFSAAIFAGKAEVKTWFWSENHFVTGTNRAFGGFYGSV